MREMLQVCVQNKVLFRFVLFDIWFSSKENMCHIHETLKKEFVCALKSNRLVAVSAKDHQAKRFTPIEGLPWLEETVFTDWLKDVPFPVCFVHQVFINNDGSTGFSIWPAVTQLDAEGYSLDLSKTMAVEVFHCCACFAKSLKQNAALGKASVHRVVTQNNHIFTVLYAAFKLECLKIKQHLSHFALRARLYLKATHIAFDELQALKAAQHQLIMIELLQYLCITFTSMNFLGFTIKIKKRETLLVVSHNE